MPSLFITGTDTDIGKTYATALIAGYLIKKGKKVGVYKPIQTGAERINGQLDSPDLNFIKKVCPNVKVKNTYCFELPATPELAAELENINIDFERIKNDYFYLKKVCDFVLVEGAGGLFVPVFENKTIADLIKFLDLPTVLVSSNKLGTINHTCLSCFYAQAKLINLKGFLFSPNHDRNSSQKVLSSNASFIERYSATKFLGNLPHFQEQIFEDVLDQLDFLKPEDWF
ncbi:MAG: dethiobiotin synthase [Candidatus Caenarcaniphilales bacterium]|nr:dethiobiotin synthase [Candidatus Caenarcaniphilales bacterium]